MRDYKGLRQSLLLGAYIFLVPILLSLLIFPRIFPEEIIRFENDFTSGINKQGESWSVEVTDNSFLRSRLNLSGEANNYAVATNTWWVGLLRESNPAPVYVFPHSLKFTLDGVEFANSPIVVSENAVIQSHVNDMSLSFTSRQDYVVNDFSDFTVRGEIVNPGGTKYAGFSMQKGNPYTQFTLTGDTEFSVKVSKPSFSLTRYDSNTYVFEDVDEKYFITSTGNITWLNEAEVNSVDYLVYDYRFAVKQSESNSSANVMITVAPVQNGIDVGRIIGNALVPHGDARVSYEVDDQNDTINMSYDLGLAEGTKTFQVLPPNLWQYADLDFRGPTNNSRNGQNSLYAGEIDTLRGKSRFVEVDGFNLSMPITRPEIRFEPNLNGEEIEAVLDLLAEDLSSISYASGSYFAGKSLFRMANIVETSAMLQDDRATQYFDTALDSLKSELADWFSFENGKSEKYFQYDAARGGLIAIPGEFDSQNYNDHHFHYGYFIYAFSTICEYDKEFCAQYSGMVDLIIRNIASEVRKNRQFTFLRVFYL